MIATSTESRWAPRPLLATGVRMVQYGVPLVLGTLAGRVAAVPAVHLPRLVAVSVVVLVAVAVSLGASRITMRLAPLALLLRMTMIFPDRAPSRMKVARRSTSVDDIRSRLLSDEADEQGAAVTMLALVTALGRHDKHTRGHSERVRLFCDLLSRELRLSDEDAGRLRWAALVHDIGKLEVSAAVLNKPGRLDKDEWASVRMHPEAGARLAAPLREWLGPWFAGIAEHHERYDGTGYPRGLAGDQISMAGRAVAVVDAFETMTAARSYKAARTAVAARAELTRCAGTHFDPMMVRAFLSIALPRLLWSVGPLAFCINLPLLRFVGDGGVKFAQAASSTAVTAANAAGVTAVVVAAGTLPTQAASAAPATDGVHVSARPADHVSTHRSQDELSSSSSTDAAPFVPAGSRSAMPTLATAFGTGWLTPTRPAVSVTSTPSAARAVVAATATSDPTGRAGATGHGKGKPAKAAPTSKPGKARPTTSATPSTASTGRPTKPAKPPAQTSGSSPKPDTTTSTGRTSGGSTGFGSKGSGSRGSGKGGSPKHP